MGQIFSHLGAGSYPQDVFIDFQNAKPTAGEQALFGEFKQLLDEGEDLIKSIHDYKGCGNLQREAMMNKTPNAEEKCFEALLECVSRINDFYVFAQKLEVQFPKLMTAVCEIGDDGKETLANKQALATQVARVFDFTLRFDKKRMETTSISNDFSYYRRLLGKFMNHPDIIVDDDGASTMAMFTAEYIPMMSCLSKSGAKAVTQNPNVVIGLALMANSCLKMIQTKRFSDEKINLLVARAMTGSVVLYDHISDLGVFHKKAPVQLKSIINLLRLNYSHEPSLINAVHFSTRTFRNAPAGIQALFE